MSDIVEDTPPTKSVSKGKRRRDSVASEEGASSSVPDSESSNPDDKIEDEITCGVCRNVLSNPYIILNCLHTVDHDCLSTWWQSRKTCPSCNTDALSAKKAFQIRAIVDHWLESRPHKRRAVEDGEAGPSNPAGASNAASEATPQEIFPFGRAAPAQCAGDPRRLQLLPRMDFGLPDEDFDFDGEDLEDEFVFQDDENDVRELGPLGPRGWIDRGPQLAWPCFCCLPGNSTGYVCPVPIPMPTDEQIQAARGPNRAPQRGEQPLPIDMARARGVHGAENHAACRYCSRYIPRDRQPEIDQCVHCQLWSCEAYDPLGCPHNWIGRILRPRNECTFAPFDGHQGEAGRLWPLIDKPHLAHNTVEAQIFTDYVSQQGKTIRQIYNDICDVKLDQATSDVDIWRWAQEARTCRECRDSILKRELYDWWGRERETGQLNAQVVGKPNCWYGYECRTQDHNNRHAINYNHMCPNTHGPVPMPPPPMNGPAPAPAA